MMHGLFACAPVAPSLAVDLRILELVMNLFARMTPNSTAWCEALETFLNERGYKLNTQVRLVVSILIISIVLLTLTDRTVFDAGLAMHIIGMLC